MYWPARNCRRSPAGSLSEMIATSSAGRSIFSTRQGSVRIARSFAPASSRTSKTMSVSARVQQVSALPAAFSASCNARSWYSP